MRVFTSLPMVCVRTSFGPGRGFVSYPASVGGHQAESGESKACTLMSYIKHLDIRTGSVRHNERGDVADGVDAALMPWLDGALRSGAVEPLPKPFAPYGARCLVQGGALMASVYTPAIGASPQLLLMSLGVARDAEQGAALWPVLLRGVNHDAQLRPPAAPWCIAHLHPAHARLEDSAWLVDLERSLAWAWITRGP